MSLGDKLTSLTAGVKEVAYDPVAKLAADAYDSITGNGFKPIKKANDADVKRLTEALKKSASSTEMLAKITGGEAKQQPKQPEQKQPEAKNAQSGMGDRAVGSDARNVVAQVPPRPEQTRRADEPQKMPTLARVEMTRTERPRILAQSQPEGTLTRVEAQQTLDKGLQGTVLDLTAKMRDAVRPSGDEQQAKDEKFLSNILKGAAKDDTADGVPGINAPPISRQDWENAFNARNRTETAPSLPQLEIVSTIFGSESGGTLDTRFGSRKGTVEADETVTGQKDKPGQLVRNADGSLFYTEGNASITRSLAGEIQIKGANDTLKLFDGKLLAFDKEGKLYLENRPGQKTRAVLGNDTYLLPGANGLDITDGAGSVVGKIEADQILSSRMKVQTAQYLDEVDFSKAMERWKRDGNKLQPGKTFLYMRFKSGFALVEPDKDQYTVVMFKENNKFEVHRKLADDVMIVKDADNRYFLNTNKARLELSPEQIEEVLKGLPEEQQKNLRKTMENLEKGVIDAPDGQLVLKEDGGARFTVVGTMHLLGVGIVPLLNFNIDKQSEELTENRTDGSKTKTYLDLVNRKYAQEETNATGQVTEATVDLADGLKAKGKDWTLDNRIFTTRDNFRVDEVGNVTTPGGSTVRITGEINFSNGMTVGSDGTVKESSKPANALNAPSEKSVDALVRNGLSLAKSLAGGGPATFAQIALLQANLSIVSNLVGLFSDLGQLSEATKLFKVWGTMNESLCKARMEVNERISRSHQGNVAMLPAPGDRFGSNTVGSGGWISCQLKAA